VLAEVQRRAALLREDVQTRKLGADQNEDRQGIHQTQIDTLGSMMDQLLKQQNGLLQQLETDLQPRQYAETYAGLLAEIAGTNGLWQVFRYMFEQRRDARIKRELDAADLVAENCYRPCITQAREWGLIDGEFREPPLVYLDAELSALTVSRDAEARSLGMDVGKYLTMRLPIPIIVLPSDQIESFWLFSTLHHEVGHNLDQDLRSRGRGERLAEELRRRMPALLSAAGAQATRRLTWQRWCEEILADAFGVLLGGAGFGCALTSLLLPQAARTAAMQTNDTHPDNFVRIYLIAAMLRRCNVPQLTAAADWIQQCWNDVPKPDEVKTYQAEADAVADLAITTPLDVLGGRPLIAIVPKLATDAQRAQALADFLAAGGDQPPSGGFPPRLVPAAAQIALTRMASPSKQALDNLHAQALDFFYAIELPDFLGADAPDADFLSQLTREIRFA